MRYLSILSLLLLPLVVSADVTNLTADGTTTAVSCRTGDWLVVSVRGTIGSGDVSIVRTDENSDTHRLENAAAVASLPMDRAVRCMGSTYHVELDNAAGSDIDVEMYTFDPNR